MSTFLELCQNVAKDSGTVSNIGQPETTTGQTGRLLRIMGWVTEAYEDIQREENAWRWMQEDFSGETVATVQQYDSAAMGISERFSRWVLYGEDGENLFTIYKTSLGQSDEGFLTYRDWSYFRRHLMVGGEASRQDKPVYFTVDNSNKLRFWPIPDDACPSSGILGQMAA